MVNFDDGVWYKGTINARARTTRRDAEAGDVGEPIQGRYKNIRVDTANDVNETPPTAWSVLFDDCTRGTFIQGDKEGTICFFSRGLPTHGLREGGSRKRNWSVKRGAFLELFSDQWRCSEPRERHETRFVRVAEENIPLGQGF